MAHRLREILSDLDLECLAKTAGGKGLHLYVPLNTPATFEQTKSLANALARMLERDDPQHVTANMRRHVRAGKVFVDWSQNDRHKTTVAAYSLRAQPTPTVSTPVTWDEVADALAARDPERLVFDAPAVLARVAEHGDLYADNLVAGQPLPDGIVR